MSGYRENDAAHDTRVTERDATAAWHRARDDSGVRTAGDGDRPTAQNYVDASRKFDEIMTRARHRAERDQAVRSPVGGRGEQGNRDRNHPSEPSRDR